MRLRQIRPHKNTFYNGPQTSAMLKPRAGRSLCLLGLTQPAAQLGQNTFEKGLQAFKEPTS